MSAFLNSLKDKLAAMEQEMQALPEELDSVVRRLDRDKLGGLLSRLDRDCDKLFNEHFAGQMRGVLPVPYIIQSERPYIRWVTSEDISRWQEEYKSKVLVVIAMGKVQVMPVSDLVDEYKTTVPQIILIAREQGYTVLGWDEYQNLVDEIGKLIGGDEEQGKTTEPTGPMVIGVPVHPTQEVKALPKNSPP